MDRGTFRDTLTTQFLQSPSQADQIELWCERKATEGLALKGSGPLSPEVKDKAVGKARSKVVEILSECRERNIPLENVLGILQTADWGR